MTRKLLAGASALSFVALLAASAPSQATTVFATYQAKNASNNLTWTTGVGTGTLSGSTDVTLHLWTGPHGSADYNAVMTFTGTGAGATKTKTGLTTQYDNLVSGTITFTYGGVGVSSIPADNLTVGVTNLLTVNFTNADLNETGTAITFKGSNLTFTSAELAFAAPQTGTGQLINGILLGGNGTTGAGGCGAVSNAHKTATCDDSLNTFSVGTTGSFQIDSGVTPPPTPPVPHPVTPVPEPASWAMMLVGFGAVGAFVRRRKALVAA